MTMAFSRHRYQRLITLSLALSCWMHLLMALIPKSVGEWFIGPSRLPVPASRIEVISLARQSAPRYATSTNTERITANRKSIVPPADSLRPRLSAADSAVQLVLSEPDLAIETARREKYFEATSGETTVQDTRADSLSLVQAYISTVLDRVRTRRRYPEAARRMGQEGEVLLAFSINRRGSLKGEIELLSPCRYGLLNRSACRSIERSAPFPPLPAPVHDNNLSLKIRLLYRLTD